MYGRTENIAPTLGPYMAPDGVYIQLAAVYSDNPRTHVLPEAVNSMRCCCLYGTPLLLRLS